MSSFLCSDKQINTIAHYFKNVVFNNIDIKNNGVMFGELSENLGFGYLSANEALKLANIFSVNKRYTEPVGDSHKTITSGFANVDEPQLIKLIDCLIYQCSGFSKNDTSKEARFVHGVIDILNGFTSKIVDHICKDAKWTIE